jgi:hypothetical protein
VGILAALPLIVRQQCRSVYEALQLRMPLESGRPLRWKYVG